MNLPKKFLESVGKWKKMRARFDQRQVLKNEFELLVKFEEETYPIWGLYQQAVVGNINVPKMDYLDPKEESWMWAWIHGNEKWHAWNKCKGMTKKEAIDSFVLAIESLEERLPALVEDWKDEQDPRIPDSTAYVPREKREERNKQIEQAKKARREREAVRRADEEAKGWWDG